MSEAGWSDKIKETGRRMGRNFASVVKLVRARKQRTLSLREPLRPGQRPQDLLAILLLTVGIAVVLLDIPSYPWIRSLPKEYRDTFSAFTDVGKAHWILWSCGILCLVLLALQADRLVFRLRMLVGAVFTYAGFIFYSVALSGILAIILKWTFGRARPKLYEQVGPVDFEFLAFHGSYTSFPSGHSTTVGALAMALALIFPTWRWLIVVGAFWAAFSRIMVGAHYPSDVIAGTLLGMTFTFFTARAMARRRIGFQLTKSGGIEPIMSHSSAKACFKALWSVLSGRRSAKKAAAGTADMTTTDKAPTE